MRKYLNIRICILKKDNNNNNILNMLREKVI